VAQQLSLGSGDGVTLGQSATDKVSLHGVTPVVQAAAITLPAATAATNSSPYGFSQAQADALVTAVRAMIVALQAKGFTL
jgi:hypothetical protein